MVGRTEDVTEGFLEKVKGKQKVGTCLGVEKPKQQPGEVGRIFQEESEAPTKGQQTEVGGDGQ